MLKALHAGGAVKVDELKNATSFKHLPVPFVFYPLHLICEGENRLYFGRISTDDSVNSETYVLLYSEQLQTVDFDIHTSDIDTLPDFIYVQTTNNDDIEILFSENNRDILLIFYCSTLRGAGKLSEYKLLSKIEVYV